MKYKQVLKHLYSKTPTSFQSLPNKKKDGFRQNYVNQTDEQMHQSRTRTQKLVTKRKL